MIALRVDCDATIGWGHLMRCMAIADCLATLRVPLVFVVAGDQARVGSLLAGRHPVHAIAGRPGRFVAETLSTFERLQVRVALLDSYDFDDAFEGAIARAGVAVAAMDDYGHAAHRAARLVINGNLHHGRPSLYPDTPAKLLLGPDYAPLRPRLSALRSLEPVDAKAFDQVLLSFAGFGDVAALARLVRALLDALPAPTRFVATMRDELAAKSTGPQSEGRIRRLPHADALDEEMARSTFAVSSGGMTSYELAFMGVPAILLPVTPAQAPVSLELERLGAAICMDPAAPAAQLAEAAAALSRSRSRRQAMATAGRSIFDGGGASRIATELAALG